MEIILELFLLYFKNFLTKISILVPFDVLSSINTRCKFFKLFNVIQFIELLLKILYMCSRLYNILCTGFEIRKVILTKSKIFGIWLFKVTDVPQILELLVPKIIIFIDFFPTAERRGGLPFYLCFICNSMVFT